MYAAMDAVPWIVFFGFFAVMLLVAHVIGRAMDRREKRRIPRARVAR